MKNKSVQNAFETLLIVLFIFFVLACRCNSDLLRLGKKSSAPSPTPVSTPLTANSPSENNVNRASSDNGTMVGSYTGSVLNTTFNKRGDLLLRIDSVDEKGGVRGFFEATNGLYGTSNLVGGVDKNGKMGLIGKLEDGQGLIVSAAVSGDAIRGNYVLGNKQKGIQKGEFTVYRK